MEFDKPGQPFASKDVPGDLLSALIPWIHGSRWHMEETSDVGLVGHCAIAQKESAQTLWLVIASGERLYNVPVVISTDESHSNSASLIAIMGKWSLHDATAHPMGQRALFELLINGSNTVDSTQNLPNLLANQSTGHTSLSFTGLPLHGISGPPLEAKRLTSEQSNTSIIYRFNGRPPVIIKLFRVLADGHNPDVELQLALDTSGTVPRQYGSVSMRWITPTQEANGETDKADQIGNELADAVVDKTADVLVAQEFLEGAKDAWQVISNELAHTDGSLGEMAESIRALGSLTRTIHDELANVFPVVPASSERRLVLQRSWRERARAAVALVPELAAHDGTIEIIYSATEHVDWPELQRIHGDYHLGQVLEVPGRGWFALDFEGEPLRPMAERTREDLALRDVAGMLRSFDYAAGSAQMAGGAPETVQEWARRAKEIFLVGYGELSEEEMVLLEALVLDKALYEVVYEATERPAWLPIPLTGISQLMGSASD